MLFIRENPSMRSICFNIYFATLFQRCCLHHPVQCPLIHECQALAMDEGLLQDQASSAKCWDRERAGQYEGGLCQMQRKSGKSWSQEEGTWGKDGGSGPRKEWPTYASVICKCSNVNNNMGNHHIIALFTSLTCLRIIFSIQIRFHQFMLYLL